MRKIYIIFERKKTVNKRTSLLNFKTKQNKNTVLKVHPTAHYCLLSRQPFLRCVYYI